MKVFLTMIGLSLLILAGASAMPQPSGLRGTVTRGPITPVCVAEQPCTRPARNVTLFFSRGGHVVARTSTDAAGKYRVQLAPARYHISRTLRPGVRRGLEPDNARVFPGRFTRADLSIDTGIR